MNENPAPSGTYKSTRAFRTGPTGDTSSNARVYGYRGGVATHHHQSALAAHNVLQAGGNAVDAGVAAVLVEGVVWFGSIKIKYILNKNIFVGVSLLHSPRH